MKNITPARTTSQLKPPLRRKKFKKALRKKTKIKRIRQTLSLLESQALTASKRRATAIAMRISNQFQFQFLWLFLHLLLQVVISCHYLTLAGAPPSSSRFKLFLIILQQYRHQSLEGCGNRMKHKRNWNFKHNLWHLKCIKSSFKASLDSKLWKWLVTKSFLLPMEVSY